MTKKQTKKQAQAVNIEALMAKAESARAANKGLLAQLRQDKSLTKEVQATLCADLRRVLEIPRDLLGPSASRRRYREMGHYSDSLVDYLFGTWEQFKRAAKIEPSLHTKKVGRRIAATLRATDEAEYADRNIKPWDGAFQDYTPCKDGWLTMVVGSDFHVPLLDPFARRVWLEVLEEVQPNLVRFNGDLVDFPTISRHRQMPGAFVMDLQGEIDGAVDFMRDTRAACPKSSIALILGNHDSRLITYVADEARGLSSLRSLSFAELFQLDTLRVGLVARASFLNPTGQHRKADVAQNWETILDADGRPLWTTVHGYLCGKDAPSKHLARFGTFGTNGHLHNPMAVTGGSLATGPLRWFQTGCMANPRAVASGYLPGPVQFNGWAITFLVVRMNVHTRHVHVEEVTVGEDHACHGDSYWEVTQSERDARAKMLEVL
jgi:hypothetical protein